MPLDQLLLLSAGVLALGALLEPAARWTRIPYSALLVLGGFVGSEILVAAGVDTGLRWDSFGPLVFFVLLPILVFETAYRIDVQRLRADLGVILALAIPLMLVAAGVSGALIYLGIGHDTGFPWVVALLTGVIVSATDPSDVCTALQRLPGRERASLLLEGEGLFNDAAAIVMFSWLLGYAVMRPPDIAVGGIAVQLSLVLLGGLGAGVAAGLAGRVALHACRTSAGGVVVIVALVYATYVITERLLDLSGVIAVLACGLVLGRTGRFGEPAHDPVWRASGMAAYASIFILAGGTITLAMFQDRWLAMLIGIAAVVSARALTVFGGLALLGRLHVSAPLSLRDRAVVNFGGTSGAVTLALALSLPLELDAWFTVQSIAYGVVIYMLFVQGPVLGILLRRR